jgi:hypothetical protein
MAKSKDTSESEVLTSKPEPSVCGVCRSEDVECCEVVLDKRWRVYYTKCQMCHEVEVFKISKDKSK